MIEVNDKGKVPVKMWCHWDSIDDLAKDQIDHLSNLPFAHKQISIMSDCHAGHGVPIGTVLATDGVIIPNATGSDVGCGMASVKLSLQDISHQQLKDVVELIKQKVPMGMTWQKDPQDKRKTTQLPIEGLKICSEEYENSLLQLGTVGSGNHFIEIQRGSDLHIWFTIHTGSRNLGYRVGNYYNEVAQNLNEKWFSSVPKDWNLAFLPCDIQEAKDYFKEMLYCVDFAKCNRSLIVEKILSCFEDVVGDFQVLSQYDVKHNYASMERHFGKTVMVHRKGAIKAEKNLIGIIPGSCGSKTYIVEGLGNIQSFCSASHGAGRVMSRGQAKKELDLVAEKNLLDSQGIIHNMTSEKNLDEATGAYKNIVEVMKNQNDLVCIKTELTPIGNIKG